MLLSRARPALTLALIGCGARTELEESLALEQLPREGSSSQSALPGDPCAGPDECWVEDRCRPLTCRDDRCIEAPVVDCDDGDPCTLDACDPSSGQCSHSPVTPDRDGDGHRAALEGTVPGSPGSCGDDCDDSSAAAHPGGVELCDGVDNDCNGAVDDGFDYAPSPRQATLLTRGARGGLGGVTHNGEYFAVSLADEQGHQQNRLAAIGEEGSVLFTRDLALTNSDTFAGPIVYNGSVFASAWEDRRDQDYEIYFNRFDDAGNKLGPDLRVSVARGFSLNPDMVFTGANYLLAWGDKRNGAFQIFAERITEGGELLSGGRNVNLTPELSGAESPSLAVGEQNLGVAFNSEADGKRIGFRTMSFDLDSLGALHVLSAAGGTGAGVTYNAGRYLVTWSEKDVVPGPAIWASIVSGDGSEFAEPTRITEPAPFARSHGLLDLGDRLLLFWAQWTDSSYDIFYRWLDPDLTPTSDARRITHSSGDALGPAPAFGSRGEIGLAYTDFSDGTPQVYFTTLECGGEGLPPL